MNIITKKYKHKININTPITINRKLSYNIHIVYFINCELNNNYMSWIINNINLVYNWKYSSLNIIVIANKEKQLKIKNQIFNIFPKSNIYFYSNNEYEYRGILKVWEIGQDYNKINDIIFYFHSKGITHHKSHIKDNFWGSSCNDINYIYEVFDIFPNINKVGWCSGGIGWIWYNWWFVRGSYIKLVEKPIKTTRRHYYEDWLSRKISNSDDIICNFERPISFYKNTLSECYGIYNTSYIANIGSMFCPNIGLFSNITVYNMSLVKLNNSETDKNTGHSYLPLYDSLLNPLKHTAKNILEIGVMTGGSIKLWYDYFPNATIYGCDIADNIKLTEIKNNSRIILDLSVNAYDPTIIKKKFINTNIKFDLVLDDGPHSLQSQVDCILLYTQLLTNDGILIIEDVQDISWFDHLIYHTPEHLKKYIKTYDLRKIKNRYDDLVFVINKNQNI
tara:strand:- start:3323 stop:4666 length:1344 start_codon:yes stop_codon:yes gene_type:complete